MMRLCSTAATFANIKKYTIVTTQNLTNGPTLMNPLASSHHRLMPKSPTLDLGPRDSAFEQVVLWRLKSRPGRPPISLKIQALIRRLANENPSWGEERIANELLLELGIQVSPRTVSKYLPKRQT